MAITISPEEALLIERAYHGEPDALDDVEGVIYRVAEEARITLDKEAKSFKERVQERINKDQEILDRLEESEKND